MWPRLTPEHLLHDLFGSKALLRHAARDTFGERAADSLYRPRSDHVSEVVWTVDDIPLLDEAHAYLGPVRGREAIRTFGHIVVDEAQDRSPMELRMLARRSLSGSMTIVGDIGQATGPWGAESWEDVLAHLPSRRDPRHIELTVGYRIPASIMGPAVAVLEVSAPWLTPPIAVRPGEDPPEFVRVPEPSGLRRRSRGRGRPGQGPRRARQRGRHRPPFARRGRGRRLRGRRGRVRPRHPPWPGPPHNAASR